MGVHYRRVYSFNCSNSFCLIVSTIIGVPTQSQALFYSLNVDQALECQTILLFFQIQVFMGFEMAWFVRNDQGNAIKERFFKYLGVWCVFDILPGCAYFGVLGFWWLTMYGINIFWVLWYNLGHCVESKRVRN